MPKSDIPFVQLATQIPKDLHRRLKLYCVEKGTTAQTFVAAALEEKLRRTAKPGKRAG